MATSSTYPLLPYSQLVYDMLKSNPNVYWTCFIMRLNKEEVDVMRVKQAVEKAILNHPVFSMYINEYGMQEYDLKQDVLHGEYYSVEYIENGQFVDIHLRVNRILRDGRSDSLFAEDVVRAYSNLPLEKDDYLNYLQRVEQAKQSPRYAQSRKWLVAEFGQLSCLVHPQTDFPIDTTEASAEGMITDDFSALRPDLNRLAAEQFISITAFFSLSSALAMMEYNGCDEAALTWAYEGRETKEEQRIYGSLHRDVPFHIKVNGERLKVKGDLLRQTRNQIRSGIAHSSYPLTLTKPHTNTWNYALNVLMLSSAHAKMKDIPFPFEVIEDDMPHVAYSLLDVEIYDEKQLIVNYRYSASHYKESSIKKFAALVRKYAEWLLE